MKEIQLNGPKGQTPKVQERTKTFQHDNLSLLFVESVKIAYLRWHRKKKIQ